MTLTFLLSDTPVIHTVINTQIFCLFPSQQPFIDLSSNPSIWDTMHLLKLTILCLTEKSILCKM